MQTNDARAAEQVCEFPACIDGVKPEWCGHCGVRPPARPVSHQQHTAERPQAGAPTEGLCETEGCPCGDPTRCGTAEPDPLSVCPNCRALVPDLDGFGVLYHPECGYCAHASRYGGVCEACGDSPAAGDGRCGSSRIHAGLEQRCTKSDGHTGEHAKGGLAWSDTDARGLVERRWGNAAADAAEERDISAAAPTGSPGAPPGGEEPGSAADAETIASSLRQRPGAGADFAALNRLVAAVAEAREDARLLLSRYADALGERDERLTLEESRTLAFKVTDAERQRDEAREREQAADYLRDLAMERASRAERALQAARGDNTTLLEAGRTASSAMWGALTILRLLRAQQQARGAGGYAVVADSDIRDLEAARAALARVRQQESGESARETHPGAPDGEAHA